ncbi:thiamine pyrophosphate-dependent dehydrogenase E1 component subunit alpha [Thermodesulfobacteriota bacterium]
MSHPTVEKMYEQMYLIRLFEVKLEELFRKGLLVGTIHCCIGQEAVAVGVINALEKDDIITGNHRSHGHFLAYSNDFEGLMGEIMGKACGVVGGRGGSQHLQKDNFYSNGVQGGMVPVATGMAMAEKLKNTGNIVVCFIGDGTLGQGIVYESLNMAALWELPIVYIVENNYYAMSTCVDKAIAGSIIARGRAFGNECSEITSNDVEKIYNNVLEIVGRARKNNTPQYCVINTYRLCGHSKSDDRCYRSKEEEEKWSKIDPLLISGKKIPEHTQDEINKRSQNYIDEIVEKITKMESPTEKTLYYGLFNNYAYPVDSGCRILFPSRLPKRDRVHNEQ